MKINQPVSRGSIATAVYRLGAVLEDMEATEKMIKELLDAVVELELP